MVHGSDSAREFLCHPPKWYVPVFHLFFPTIVSLIIIGICASQVISTSITIFLVSLISWIILLGLEWGIHRYILHNPFSFLNALYRYHRIHHFLFSSQNMLIKNRKELFYVLLPPYAILLVFGLIAPLAFGIGLIFSLNISYLIIINAMIFFLMYEWLHLSYHLPINNWILNKLRRLHQIHHHPKLQKSFNFNVTIPLFDWILNTRYK